MLTQSITLFKLLGFTIKIDFTWIFLAVLITWSLATGLFPVRYPGHSETTYWLMGVEGALGLFISIILHELGHSLVARRVGIEIRGITLFIFGGVAEMEHEPKRAQDEYMMAIAGPMTSAALAIVLFLIFMGLENLIGENPYVSVISYLALINIILALFNMVPAFPLDGGRILRAVLWKWKDDIRWATRVSSALGSGFGLFLIVAGALFFMGGEFIAGAWWVMIGLFVRSASKASYRDLVMRRALEGEPVSRFMQRNTVSVPGSASIHEVVEDFVYRYHFKTYPVMQGEHLLGVVSIQGIKEIPRDEWLTTTAATVAEPCTENNCIRPEEDAMEALARMRATGKGRLLVVEQGELLGIIARKDLLEFLALKIDLESGSR